MKFQTVLIGDAVEGGEKNWEETRTGPIYAFTIEVPHEITVVDNGELLEHGLDPTVHDVHRKCPEP
jgi:hypothetical protein